MSYTLFYFYITLNYHIIINNLITIKNTIKNDVRESYLNILNMLKKNNNYEIKVIHF